MVVGSYLFPTVVHDALAYLGAQNLKMIAVISCQAIFNPDSLTQVSSFLQTLIHWRLRYAHDDWWKFKSTTEEFEKINGALGCLYDRSLTAEVHRLRECNNITLKLSQKAEFRTHAGSMAHWESSRSG
jgi:hypothetical protein